MSNDAQQPYPDEQTWWKGFEAQCEELYRQAGQLDNWGGGTGASRRWNGRTAYDIAAGMIAEASAAKHLEELRNDLGLITPLPPLPSRSQVCNVHITFQGLTVNTQQFGSLPWFEAALTSLTPRDRQSVYAAKHQAGDGHCIIALTWAYQEAGQPYMNIPGCDMSGNLAQFRSIVEEVIRAGFFPILFLGGDGQGAGPNFNDPVGWTYGHDWLMGQLPGIISSLQSGVDLTPYCLFSPGFDGVFYGWNPDQVEAFGASFRQLLPNGYLAIEHNTGHIPIGNGPADYALGGPMQSFDVILSEFDANLHQDSCWQVISRLIQPYHRPPDQPSSDDPNPPHYLAAGTPRGPFTYVAFEWAAYDWVRSRISTENVQVGRDYLTSMGCEFTG